MSSSWHPAFMPNATQPPATVSPSGTLLDNQAVAPDASTALEGPAEIKTNATAIDTALPYSPSAPLPEAITPTNPTPAAHSDPDAEAEAAEAQDTYDPSPVISPHYVGPKAGHWSSMSFARTAQEVNFDDEDGAEWGLQRTGTDPFRFMAPNERSNSFPVVPPSAHHSRQASEAQPMPNAATEALMSVPSGADDHFDTPHGAHSALVHSFDDHDNDDDNGEDAWDLKPANEEVLGGAVADDHGFNTASRFEEGLPLISPAAAPTGQDNATSPATPAIESAIQDAFAREANTNGDDDDFFNRAAAVTVTENVSQDGEGNPRPLGLERKSTMQAMGTMDTPNDSRTMAQPSLNIMVEETEEEKIDQMPEPVLVVSPEKEFTADDYTEEGGFFDQIAHQSSEPVAAQANPEVSQANTEAAPNLEAKWEEAFADDDDAGFLDGTAPGVDVDGFLSSDDDSLLDDDDDDVNALAAQTAALSVNIAPAPGQQQDAPVPSNPYLPTAASPQQPSFPRTPTAHASASSNPYSHAPTTAVPSAQPSTYTAMAPPSRPELQKVSSFADKSKSGYTSPYDLPMDVVKPRRRPSTQTLVRPNPGPSALAPSGSQQPPAVAVPPQMNAPPVRSSSFSSSAYSPVPPAASVMAASPYTAGVPPPGAASSTISPPGSRDASSMSVPPISGSGPPSARPSLKSKGSGFFEDLPVVSKPRSGSRAPTARAASPAAAASGAAGYFPVQPSPLGHPSQAQAQPHPHPHPAVSHATSHMASPLVQLPSTQPHAGLGLVTPDRVNPYAPQPVATSHTTATTPSTSRYSSVPPNAIPPAGQHPVSSQPSTGPPPAPINRYSPAPPAPRPSQSYAPASSNPMLPHQPRTSSPLAYMEMPGNDSQPPTLERRSSHSSQYESKQTRVPSLPPTWEVDEETSQSAAQPVRNSSIDSRYSPAPAHAVPSSLPALSTPPPPSQNHVPLHPSAQSTLSPPKRANANYAPSLTSTSPRKSYASPAAGESTERRPSSSYAPVVAAVPPPTSGSYAPAVSTPYTPVSPVPYAPIPAAASTTAPVPLPPKAAPGQTAIPGPTGTASQYSMPAHQPAQRPRAPSLTLNLVAPTDGREHDPLQRWKGNPIISWSASGNIVTSFPKNIPRYTAGVSAPTMFRTAGEIKVHHIKDMIPLDERVVRFPGPLKGKGKKKEVVAWLTSGIEALERELPDLQFVGTLSTEQHRAVERILLWKLLRIMVENDGAVDGSESVEAAVRELLTPGLGKPTDEDGKTTDSGSGYIMNPMSGIPNNGIGNSSSLAAEAVDPSAVHEIKRFLAIGDREKAVWAAADKRLWAHAMLIANAASPELYRQVAQEFVRKEVNSAGHKNESLAALYKVLSGNSEECVDELVSSHARVGMKLVAAAPSTADGLSSDSLDGLNKWRETVALILSNRSSDDLRALVALGDLLIGYGRAEAAHVCFLFAKSAAVFSGLDDPRANFVLVGADHRGQVDQFAKEIEPFLLSDIFEYALSLSPAATTAAHAGVPHLTAYKLHLALILAEYGYRDKALQYCEAIITSINAQTRRSPYHHPILEITVDDLLKRLRSAPKEETNSWLPKPSINKVSDSMWNRFNKFVAGDGEDGTGDASGSEAGGADIGPFARITGGTPTISRSPSVANFADAYTSGMPNLAGPLQAAFSGGMASPPSALTIPPGGRAASRYAPSPMLSSSAPAVNPYSPAPPGQSVSEYGSSRVPSYGASSAVHGQTGYFSSSNSSSALAPAPGLLSPTLKSPINFSGQGQSVALPYAPVSAVDPTSAPPQTPSQLQQTQPSAPPSINQDHLHISAPPSFGYEPPSLTPVVSEPESESKPASGSVTDSAAEDVAPAESSGGGFEPPFFQPYSYEPPSYEPDSVSADADDNETPKPKKKSFMDVDDDDDILGLKQPEKSKSDRDRENEEMFRRIAEEEAKKAAEEKAAKAKKGWGFGGWFAGKKDTPPAPSGGAPGEAPKATRANLGEASSFVYDPELKRWINKKPGADTPEAKKPAPPPPRSSGPTPSAGTPPSGRGTPPPPPARTGSVPPPMGGARGSPGGIPRSASMANLAASANAGVGAGVSGGPPPLPGANSAPGAPSRPGTSMSNASSIDDLLSVAPRSKGAKNKKRGGRYVDVMANGSPAGL
ncbi:uncharacterized protein BROUX77_004270 [Berkeleyomyces rouxiae]|uniref:uncharacterized protein n=1 Tax=Berkeleyomyces rouxiae TaxID=2035830 RepID=UPI003B7A218E